MSKLNITKTEWLELVFEGKNKAYGAYKLRQENETTTAKAFFSALALLTGLAMLPMFLSSFTDSSIVVKKPTDPTIVICKFYPPVHPIAPAHPNNGGKKVPANTPPIVVKANTVEPSTELPKNTEPSSGNTGNTDTNTTNTGTVTTGSVPVVETPRVDIPTGPLSPAVLEKNPMFPGGIEEFLKLVGKRFQAPEMEEAATIRVIVMFIVEKDGSLSNITVPRTAGKELDEEAIRVLKSIKTKWEPGIYKGFPVRTQYTLPIVVKAN